MNPERDILECLKPRARRTSPHRAWPLAAALALGACQGSLEGPPSSGNEPPGTPGPLPADLGPSEEDRARPTGTTMLRRLNRHELKNTLGALLGASHPKSFSYLDDALPADPRVQGFDTIAEAFSISESYVQQLVAAMDRVAAETDVLGLSGCASAGSQCVEEFATTFGLHALRRPVTSEELSSYLALYSQALPDHGHEAALRAMLTRLLLAPDLLYLLPSVASGPLTGHALASRLSYALWESMPDAALLDAAREGRLETALDAQREVTRMLADPRAANTLNRFVQLWLETDDLDRVTKDPAVYPEFEGTRGSMQQELANFLENVVLAGDGTLTTLFTSRQTVVDAPLAALYGVPFTGAIDGTQRISLDPEQRAGVLTQPAFLAMNGKANKSAPILRGIFVRERLLCQTLPPPPPNASAIPPELPSPTTTRDFFANLTNRPECSGCHALINPTGFAFEHYDGIGRYRDSENGFPIDSNGSYQEGQEIVPVVSATDLAQRLATSAEVERCLVRQWFRVRFGRIDASVDEPIIEQMTEALRTEQGSLRALPKVLVASEAFFDPRFQSGVSP
jgi:hypothetical protein